MRFWKKDGGQKKDGGPFTSTESRHESYRHYDNNPHPDAWPYLNVLNDMETVGSLIFRYLDSLPDKNAPARDITLHVITEIFDSDENLRRLNAIGTASDILKDARMKMKKQGTLLYDPETQLWSLSNPTLLYPPDKEDLALLEASELGTGWQKAFKKSDVAAWLYRNLTPDGFEQFCVGFLAHQGCHHVRVSEKHNITEKIRNVDGGIDGYGAMCEQSAPDTRFLMAFQSKKYSPRHAVGEKEVRDFVGALAGVQAPYGFFLTTGFFSTPAKAYLERLKAPQVAALDGVQMVDRMLPDSNGPGFGLTPGARGAILVKPSFLLLHAGELRSP